MEKEKFDFEKYLKWCEEKHVEASESSSLEEYKVELQKVAETGEKERKIAEQKEVFNAIAKYLGKKVEYDPAHYDGVEGALESIVQAMEMCNMIRDIAKSVVKTMDKYDKK